MKNIGVIGVGNISASHIRGYLQFPDNARIVALCDIVPEKAEAAKAKWSLEHAAVVDYEQLLQMARDGALDLVSNCTPPSEHARLTIDLLNAGANVLVEKPMAPSLAECDAMNDAAKTSGKMLSVVAQNRFRDDLSLVKAAIDSGLIGEVAHAQVDSAWWRDLAYYDLDWRGTWESEGGGPTLNHAIHHLDLILWMLGVPKSVSALMVNAWHTNSEVEDLSVALLEYPAAIATLTASVNHHGEPQAFVVQGRHASVAQPWKVEANVGQKGGFPYPAPNGELVEQLEALRSDKEPLEHTGHAGQIGDVLSALETGRTPAVTGADGRLTVELVTAIYAAAIERMNIPLPINPDSPWYTGAELIRRAPRFGAKRQGVASLGNGSYEYGGND